MIYGICQTGLANKKTGGTWLLKLGTAYFFAFDNAIDLFTFIEYNYHKCNCSGEISTNLYFFKNYLRSWKKSQLLMPIYYRGVKNQAELR